MSERQEQLKARLWESTHKIGHEKTIAELQILKSKLDDMDVTSESYKTQKAAYDSKYQAAEDFFMQYYE